MTTTVMPSFLLMSLIRVRIAWVVLGSSALVASSQAKQAAAYMRAQPGITVEEVTGE